MIREKEQARHEQRTTNILFNRKLPHHRKLLHMVRSSIVFFFNQTNELLLLRSNSPERRISSAYFCRGVECTYAVIQH